jgi:putative chitinase
MSDLLQHVDAAFLRAVGGAVPRAKMARQAEIIAATAAQLSALMDRFEIDTPKRITHFVAQIGHESDSFCTTREYASGAVYEGRSDLGNIEPGDGIRYRGRGLIQNTGRTNARNFTLWIRHEFPDAPDFEAFPSMMEEFPWAVWVAIWFWRVKNLNVLADRDDLDMITRVINGGRNGLADRKAKLAAAERLIATKAIIAPIVAGAISTSQNNFPVLYRGIKGRDADVATLQRSLRITGSYYLTIDGVFGAGTEAAVKAYQANCNLVVDGIVGAKTSAALGAALRAAT